MNKTTLKLQRQIPSNWLNHHPSGQVAIVILLIMVVLLTVGLSLASRTTQDLFLSQQESESARVFNAAEVGVDDALSYDFDLITETDVIPLTDQETVENVTTNTTIQPSSTLETQLVEGAAVQLNLTGFAGPIFLVKWAKETSCASAASLLISIYYDDGGTTEVVHRAYAPGSCRTDDYQEINNPAGDYYRQVSVPVPSGAGITPLFARIRAVYHDTALRVSAGGLPIQFYTITSQANTQIGEESRTIQVGRSLSGTPSFMDYAVYSGANITQKTTP